MITFSLRQGEEKLLGFGKVFGFELEESRPLANGGLDFWCPTHLLSAVIYRQCLFWLPGLLVSLRHDQKQLSLKPVAQSECLLTKRSF